MTRAGKGLPRAAVAVAGVAAALVAAPAAAAAEQQAYSAALNYATPALVMAEGDSLRHTNLDVFQHDIDSDEAGRFQSPAINGGESVLVEGTGELEAGGYPFHCSLHNWMKGTLNVVEAGIPGTPPLPTPDDPPTPLDAMPRIAPKPLGPSEWPSYGRDISNSRNGGASGPSWNEINRMGLVWAHETLDGGITGTPVVAEGTIVSLASGGSVIARDASTGAERWTVDLDMNLNGTAVIDGGVVYVPIAEPHRPSVAALDLDDGAELWRTRLDDQVDSGMYGSPTVWDGKVFVGISAQFDGFDAPEGQVRGAVLALDAATGAVEWKTWTVPGDMDGGAVWSTPAVDPAEGVIYAGTGNAYHGTAAGTTDSILKLDAATGELLDHFQATAGDVWSGPQDSLENPDADFGASPNLFTAADGTKVVGEGQKAGIYWALDRDSMQPIWKATVGAGSFVGGVIGSTALDARRIYGPNNPGGLVWALSREESEPLAGDLAHHAWFSVDGDPLHFSPVAVANGVVYTTDMAGFLAARDASTGAVLGKLPVGEPSWGGVAVAGGYVFAHAGIQGRGHTVAYRVQD